MTTEPSAHDHPPMPKRITSPGDLIAAIPAFIGFTPARSVVLVCLEFRDSNSFEVVTVMRHDLTLPDQTDVHPRFASDVSKEMQDVSECLADVCARHEVPAVLAVIVDDRGVTVDGRFMALAETLSEDLQDRGVLLAEVYLIGELTAGSRWRSAVGFPKEGFLPDPRMSSTALAFMFEGRGVHESRMVLATTVSPVDNSVSREVAVRLASGNFDDAGSDKARLETIVAGLAEWNSSSPDRPAVVELAPERIAAFGAAVQKVMVRDGLLALVLTEFATLAEQLWTLLMRHLPAPERACPATLLAFTAYARGDGALASVALEVAHEADRDYSLAHLLSRSLAAAAQPSMIKEVALSGYAVAELCGVRLPPPIG